ncbi:hypothetical protein F5148DRAFT_858797 [Russula earlei]|uniref:Uncharacterized protein n=1 Tax=Russula earlei TaxID=71964 RepID=A0ACC0TS51_9AGAM|nr:hypothetical protein F5148DRAFT_858797 [Russula earlei]
MAHIAPRTDIGDAGYGGNAFPQSESPLRSSSLSEDESAPSQSAPMDALPYHFAGHFSQWAPALSSSGPEHFGMPYTNNITSGYDARPVTQYNAPHAPAMSGASPYKNYGPATGNANRIQDNRFPSGRDLHARFSTGQPSSSGSVIEYGPSYGTFQAGAYGAADSEEQSYAANAEAPAPSPSENLRTFARQYILHPGTRIDTINISSGYGRVRVTITLEAADGI